MKATRRGSGGALASVAQMPHVSARPRGSPKRTLGSQRVALGSTTHMPIQSESAHADSATACSPPLSMVTAAAAMAALVFMLEANPEATAMMTRFQVQAHVKHRRGRAPTSPSHRPAPSSAAMRLTPD